MKGGMTMAASQCYADGYYTSFANEVDFLDFIKERRRNAEWKRMKANSVKVKAINEIQTDLTIRPSVWEDTLKNTRLVLETEDGEYPVRNCAIKTILERARISGNALSKVKKDVFADIVNYCLNVAQGDALLKIADEKVSALHGGDESDYAILEMPELFNALVEYFNKNFADYKYEGGSYEHSLVTAIWSFPNSDELVDTYKKVLINRGMQYDKLTPAVRFTTSDAGTSGANLYLMLLTENNRGISLGSPLKLNHKNKATIEDFKKNLNLIYAKYLNAMAELGKLLDIDIDYPLQTMMRVMKFIGVTKKPALSALSLFKAQNGEAPCTAHDLFLGINEAVFFMECNGEPASKIVQMEENVARALKVDWKEFDYPDEVNW